MQECGQCRETLNGDIGTESLQEDSGKIGANGGEARGRDSAYERIEKGLGCSSSRLRV